MKMRGMKALLSVALSLSLITPNMIWAQEEEEQIEEVSEEPTEETVEENNTDLSCGENATFEIIDTILTISGTGKVTDTSGWEDYKEEITKVVINEGITELPAQAFKDYKNLKEVKIPSTMEYIGSQCFEGCSEDLVVDMKEDMDTSSWAEDWYCALSEEIVQDNVVLDDHWHISEDYQSSGEDERYKVQIDGDDCFIPGESKSYTATLYETVDGVTKKVSGASYNFSMKSNYASFTKNSGNTCTIAVNSSAVGKISGFYIWCDVSYGSYKEQGWKYVFIETEYYTLEVSGMTANSKGNYSINKGRQETFSLDLIRHYYSNGSYKTQTVSTTEQIDFSANNIEIYDSAKKRVYLVTPGETYTIKHAANGTDVVSFEGWVSASDGNPIEVTKDITIEAVQEKAEYLGYSLSLSGNIAVNYYMALNDELASDTKAYMSFTMPDGSFSKVYVKDASKTTVGGEECYIFTHAVSAKNMTSSISSKLVNGSGKVVEENTYSVNTYINYVIKNSSSFSTKAVNITKALSTYGYYTQQYFGYNLSNLPTVVNPLETVDYSTYAYQLSDDNEEVSFIGARLVLTSKPGLKLYFKGDAGFSVEGVDATVSTEGKYTVVTISNIDDMKTMYTIKGNDIRLTYGIFSYAHQHSQSSENTKLTNLLQAMYAYSAYFS